MLLEVMNPIHHLGLLDRRDVPINEELYFNV
jgi:hypothetical protein